MRSKKRPSPKRRRDGEPLEPRHLLSASAGAFVPGSTDLQGVEPYDRTEYRESVDRTTGQSEPFQFVPSGSQGVAAIAVNPIDDLRPLGSLAHRQEISGDLAVIGAVESATIDLTPNHTIALTIESDASLRADVTLRDPGGTIIAQSTAASAGDPVFIQSTPAGSTGTYTIEYRGATGGPMGTFESTVLLNAAIETEELTGVDNSSLATAQDIDAAFVDLESPDHERAFVVGSRGDDLDEDFESGFLNAEWQTSSSTANGRAFVTSEAIAASGEHFLLMDRLSLGTPTLNEAIWTVDLSQATAATLSFSYANFSDEANSPTLPTTFNGSFDGDGVAVSEDGTTWHTILVADQTPDGEWTPFTLDLGAFATTAGIALDSDFHIKFQQFDNSTFPQDGRGFDAISIDTTPAFPLEDWYSFSLDDGEAATLALEEFNFSSGSQIELYDAGSTLIATSEPAANSSQIVLDFVDGTTNASTETYYARVISPTDEYGLLVARETSFDRETNTAFETAQEISSTGAAVGHVAEIASSSLSLLDTFAGPNFTGFIPPDPIIAVGPDQIVASVNAAIAIYDKTTGQELFSQTMAGGPGTFFDSVGGTAVAFDPWIVYDVDSERFFFVAIDVESEEFASLYLAISTDSTPTSGADWHKYKLNFAHDPVPLGLGTGNHFPDYEKISVTDDAVYISGNYFAIGEGSGVYAGITAFDKSTLLNGQPANIVYQEFIAGGFSVFPLDQRGLGDVQYFAETRSPNMIRIHAVTDVLTNPVRHTHDVVVPAFDEPVNVPQLSGATPVEAISSRIMSGVWRDGSAWFTHPITDPAIGDGETVSRWYEVATNDFPTNVPTLVQSESIDPGPDVHAFMPAIAVDGDGNMGIGFSLGGPNMHVGAGYTGRLATDPAGTTISPVAELIDGKASYDVSGGTGRNRWGDYSGMVVDPIDDKTFWAINLYANAGGSWSTQLGSFQIDSGPDVDYYSFQVNVGDTLTIETSTPFDALSSAPNVPDLEIELFDSLGASLGADLDSAADLRNAQLMHTATTAETLVVRVATTLGDGSYVLKVDGATGSDLTPVIQSSVPDNGLLTNQFPETVTFDVSEAVDVRSVTIGDLSGDLTATDVSVVGSTITFTIDGASNTGDGTYSFSLAAGAISDLQGNSLSVPFAATFTLDTVGIQILSSTWNAGPMPVDKVFAAGDLDFEAILSENPLLLTSGRRGALTPGTDDVVLTDVNLGTTFGETFLEYDQPTLTFRASYAGLVEGTYELRMRSGPGAFIDPAGNGLDGDLNPPTLPTDPPDGTPTGDGTPGDDYAIEIFVDADFAAPNMANSFIRQGTQSAAISRSADNTGYLHSDADTDRFSFYAQAGEIISVVATVDRAVTTTIAIPSISGATQTAAAASEPVYLQGVPIVADGTYELEISADDFAYYDIQIFRNAILEPVNSDLDGLSPIAIDGGTINIVAPRTAIVGNTISDFELVHMNNPALFFDISPTGIEGTPITLGEDLEAQITTTIGNEAFPAGDVFVGDNGGILSGFSNLAFQNFPIGLGSQFSVISGYALLPFWDDLSPFRGPTPPDTEPELIPAWAGETTIGGVPALIIQWEQFTHFSLTNPFNSGQNPPPLPPPNYGDITFQVQVFESGPVLARYSYKDVTFPNNPGPDEPAERLVDGAGNATVGYLNADGRFVEYSFNTPVLADGDAIELRVRPDIDTYTVDLSSKVGNNIDIVLAAHGGQDLANEILEIYDDGGNLLAAGLPGLAGGDADNFGLAILDFQVPNIGTGVFTIRVSSRQDGAYEVVVIDSMKIEAEPNMAGDVLRQLDGNNDRMLGYLDGSDGEDRIEVDLAAGDQIRLTTATPFFDPMSDPLVDLDPAITLFASDGTTVLLSDADSLDGRNADLTFSAPGADSFVIAVTREAGAGEYVLESDIIAAAVLSIDDVSVTEGDSGTVNLDFTVSRSHTLTDVSVDFATVDGVAIAGEDFVANSGTLNFLAGGDLTKNVSVVINGDIAAEINETFTVELTSPVTATIGDGVGTGTITNDDLAAITRVGVAGGSWNPDIKALPDFDLELGYPIQHGANQLASNAWNNITQLFVEFTSDVTITKPDVSLYGVNTIDHTSNISTVSFLDNVATITLFSPLLVDKYLLKISEAVTDVNGLMLDGEWTTSVSTISGDDVAGGDFLYRFNVLPGDGTREGGVTGPDISLPRDARFALIGASPIYDPIADYNANGFIDGIDISIARDNRFRFVPFGEPSVPAPVALAAVAAYRDEVELDAKQSATTDDEGDGRRFLQIRSLKKTPVWLESPLSAWIS